VDVDVESGKWKVDGKWMWKVESGKWKVESGAVPDLTPDNYPPIHGWMARLS